MAQPLTDQQMCDAMDAWHNLTYIDNIHHLQWDQGRPAPAMNAIEIAGALNMPAGHVIGGNATTAQMLEHPYIGPHPGVEKVLADLNGVELGRLNLARRAFAQFMAEICPHSVGPGGVAGTWNRVLMIVIRQQHWLAKHRVSSAIETDQVLSSPNQGGCRVEGSATCLLKNLIAFVTGKQAYGNITLNKLQVMAVPTRGNRTEGYDALLMTRSKIHKCFVRPALIFFMETMDPNGSISWDALVGTNLSKVPSTLQKRADKGYWSNESVLEKINQYLQSGAPLDPKTCEGLFYPYARMISLYYPGLHKKKEAENHLTDGQAERIGLRINQHIVPWARPAQ